MSSSTIHSPYPLRRRFLLLFLTAALGIWACAHGPALSPTKVSPYLAEQYPVRLPANVKPKTVTETARAYLGTRYRYGGSQIKGADCSGFVTMVFQKFGVHLPHSAAEQARLGEAIPRENLRAGDLVFFATSRKGPSHVGIYLGHGKFIHASSGEKRVVITALDSAYYGRRFLGGKRLVHI